WQKKFELDVYYVKNISFLLDLKIMFLTALKVLKRSGVSKEGHVTTEKFNGKN
ncbi:undecaprenyl phosphate N,N'-diacetylbacillosamine 1-phosphate transferase, partial [Campylobacter jejuni]|nr:undecaprenyl phosphate N,N'-diacetylbacillosamine 1-phosphate transferase [Campylobacter jejuni]